MIIKHAIMMMMMMIIDYADDDNDIMIMIMRQRSETDYCRSIISIMNCDLKKIIVV